MEQLTEFALNHWILVTIFFTVLGLLIANLVVSSGGIGAPQAVVMINREGAVVVDVRPRADYDAGHIIDALHLPLAEIKTAGDKLKKHRDRPLLVYCGGGGLASQAVRELKRQGFARVHVLKGGINAWRAENLPVTAA